MREEFAGLPYREQLAWLDANLATQPPERLLELCSQLRDAAPLAYLTGKLAGTGYFAREPEHFADFLIGLPETTVHAVLKSLTHEEVGPALLEALKRVPFEALGTFCLIDRALKHSFPGLRDGYLRGLVEECAARLQAGQSLSDEELVRIPARALRHLPSSQALEEHRERLAKRAIELLARAPKAVSQTNAEELLSRRVYTDPGHFLIELLQNADDAEASTFRVIFEEHRIVVWHDGVPFDARDLVGVTSIGQTTKRKQQIGFFGVGFKSVYEVADRPQIYSEAYRFEIADVSIPRYLATRPADLPQQGTALVLPLRTPGSGHLYRRAVALDPCLLLTLKELEGLEFSHRGERHALKLVDGRTIRQEPEGWSRTYRLGTGHYRYREARERGRPDETRVMVGLLERDGRPVPLEKEAPTVYSYLPTAEHTGLRFFIQGHFDVPVDRERIAAESDWNRWILDKVPGLLAEVAAGVETLEEARGLLEVLPLAEEIASPLFESVGRLQGIGRLPCTDGRLRTPPETMVASPALTELVGDQAPLLEVLPERSRRLALELGARPFGFPELLDQLESGPLPRNTARLLDLILEELEQLEREDRLELVWSSEERLRNLPLLPQGPPTTVFRAAGRLRQVYEGVRPLIPAALEERPRCIALLERLGCRQLTEHDLVNDAPLLLKEHREIVLSLLAESPWTVVEQAGTLHLFGDVPLARMYRAEEPLRGFYGERRPVLPSSLSPAEQALAERLNLPALDLALLSQDLHLFDDVEVLHEVLAELAEQITEPIARRLSQAAIWPDREGNLHPLEELAVPDDPRIPGLLPEQRFLDPKIASKDHVRRLKPGRLDVNVLLERSSSPELLELVLEQADKLTSLSVSRLFHLPIFGDQHGHLHRLSELCLPPDPELQELLPGRPFLREGSLELQVAERVGLLPHLKRPGPQLVLEELHRIAPPERALQYLAARASELSRAQVSRCLGLPIYPDQAGQRAPLGVPVQVPEGDRVYACAAAFRPLFEAAGMRTLQPQVQDIIEPLLETAGWPRAELDTAVQLLWRLTPVSRGGRRHPLQQELPLVHRLLVEHRHQLLERYASLSTLAIWEAVDGGVVTGSQVVEGEPLLELVEPGTPERRRLDARRLESLEPFRELEPMVRPTSAAEFLEELITPGFLSTPERVTRAAALLEKPLTMDALGRLRRELLPGADRETLELLEGLPLEGELAHPGAPAEGEVEPLRVLEAALEDPRLFSWLVSHESRVFSDAACRSLLMSAPIFPTRGGRRVPASRLVTDPDLPELGIDWSPAETVPAECLRLLERHLDVGRPRLEELVEQHLLPAYPDRPEEILDYLALRLEHASERTVRSLLKGLDVSDRLIPPADLEEAVAALWDLPPVKPNHRSLLLRLGAPQLPDGAMLQERLSRPFTTAQGLALARLLPRLPELPDTLHTAAWLPDGLGRPRPPVELFFPGPEVESLVGTFPDLYPQPQRLDTRLELRDASDARLPELLRHLDEGLKRGEPISPRFYRHLDSGLGNGRIDPGELSRSLSNRAWILSDDGLYFNHRKVLASSAFRLFGDRRGYWENATGRYPALCRLFGIPERVRPEDVESFLQEVAGGSASDLGRMLANCYVFLAEASHPVSRSLPVILARQGSLARLVAAETPGLVRSDTPSLEALFEKSGRLWVADPGPAGSEQEVDRFYRLMGIPRLRDAYSVGVAEGGRDRTEQMQEPLQNLRRLLRALLEVMPRVRLQRTHLAAEGWVYAERLGALAGAGAIRAIEDLKILYSLPGVGSTAQQAPAAFDRPGGRLLIDAAVLQEPRGHTTGLAAGLTPCIYDGPGEEQVTDILEILIPLGTRQAMDAYLDRRHFPVSHERATRDPLAERLGELLDYGLHRRLERAFPELDGAEFERWRTAREPEARALFKLLGVEPSKEAVKTLEELLKAPDLEKLPAALRERQPEAVAPPAAAPPTAALAPAARRVEAVEPGPGLWNRLTDWLGNALKEAMPRWAVSENGLTPLEQVESQLWATPKAVQQLREAPSRAGLTYAPSPLAGPHVYGLFSPAGRFDPAHQRWNPAPLARLPLTCPTYTGQVVEFNGTMLPGESRLPMPLYSRLEGRPRVSGRAGTTATLKGPDPQGGWTVRVEGQAPVSVSYQVRLGNPPRAAAGRPAADPELVSPTVPRASLPAEVGEWLARTAADPRPDWEKALAAQDFVRRRYLYDEEYLLRPEARRAQGALVAGRGNHHLAILHAGRQGNFLGAGICYELNLMVLELLRHLSIPSLLSTCWVFDLGRVERPDHLIALALVSSAEGECLLPLDAAADTLGPRHPLGQVDEELQLLQRAALALGLPLSADKQELRRTTLAAMGNPQLLELYLRCLRGDLEQVVELPPGVQELYERGLVKVSKVDAYSVTPL